MDSLSSFFGRRLLGSRGSLAVVFADASHHRLDQAIYPFVALGSHLLEPKFRFAFRPLPSRTGDLPAQIIFDERGSYRDFLRFQVNTRCVVKSQSWPSAPRTPATDTAAYCRKSR